MITLQFIYELKQLLRDRTVWLLFLFLAVIMVFGAMNGKKEMERKRQIGQEQVQKQEEKFALLRAEADSITKGLKTVQRWFTDPLNPLVLGELRRGGRLVSVEPSPVALIATGISDLTPEAEILYISRSASVNSNDYSNPVTLAFGAFDLAFVVTYLLPLFIIALSFNLVSKEREQGTLPLLYAQPVHPAGLFGAKMFARFALMSVLILFLWIPLLVGYGVPVAHPGLLLSTAAVLLYALFWFLAALLVNFLRQSSAFNAIACTSIWLILTLLFPILVNSLAEKARPVPSRASLVNELRQSEGLVEEQQDEVLGAFYRQHPELSPNPDGEKGIFERWVEILALSDYQRSVQDRIIGKYDEQAQRHYRFVQSMTGISPALSIHHYLVALAGTGKEGFERNNQRIREQQVQWAQTMRTKYFAQEKLTPEDYDQIAAMPASLPADTRGTKSLGVLWLALQSLLAAGAIFAVQQKARQMS